MATSAYPASADFTLGKSWYRWVILLACVLIYSSSHLVRWNYSSITQFLMADLKIGKPELGVLGAAFFYSYALVQIPWGMAADKWGARKVIPFAIFILGFVLAGFAFSQTYEQAIFWRCAMGVFAATGYVSITAVLSKWFSIRQRGLAMALFSGVGGAAGEGISFLLIPIVSLVMSVGFFGLAGWRGATFMMGGVIIVIGVAGYLMLRSDPEDMGLPSIQKAEDADPDKKYGDLVKQSVKSPVLWLLSVLLSCYIVGTRLIPAWIPLYATDFYIHYYGMDKKMAIVAGGVMATVYVAGRCCGSPVIGQISDMLLKKKGVPRSAVMAGTMVLFILIFWMLTQPISSPILLGVLAFMAGAIINSFPIINATSSEILSVKSAGFNFAVINTVAQFAGAFTLTASGFMAVKYGIKGGIFHTEFLGIWYMGIIAGFVGLATSLFIIKRELAALREREAHKQ